MENLNQPPYIFIFVLMVFVGIFFPFFWQKTTVSNRRVWPNKARVLIGVWYIAGVIFSLIFIYQVKPDTLVTNKTLFLLPQSGFLYILIISLFVNLKQLSLISKINFGVLCIWGYISPVILAIMILMLGPTVGTLGGIYQEIATVFCLCMTIVLFFLGRSFGKILLRERRSERMSKYLEYRSNRKKSPS